MTNQPDLNPDELEAIINWTLSGLAFYYRDADLEPAVIDKFQPGLIFRAATFVDVSTHAGRPTKRSRFIIASSHAAPIYRINPATEKWNLHTITANSYFKVLDVYQVGEVTQTCLLHIPVEGIALFRHAAVNIDPNGQQLEPFIIERARASLDQKLQAEVRPEFEEEAWLARTSFPIGLDMENEFFPLFPGMPAAEKRPADEERNEDDKPAGPSTPAAGRRQDDQPSANQPAKKSGGFWSRWFGK